jgi:hypothetical protein
LRQIESYLSQCKYLKVPNPLPYIDLKNWVGKYTPDGSKYQVIYELAQQSKFNPGCISEVIRHTREIQSVSFSLTCAQDHTIEMTKNYQSTVGAKACWTCCSETGEIACAVLVRTTKASQFSHAAEQLARRKLFRPKVMYANTWPHLDKYWEMVFGPHLVGRLGLFHFMQRIVKTLRESHIDN